MIVSGEWGRDSATHTGIYSPLEVSHVWAATLHLAELHVLDNRSLLVIHSSLAAHLVKRLLAVRETWVQSLGQEDPLEKEMAIPSSILAWRIPRTEEPGGYPFQTSQCIHVHPNLRNYPFLGDLK